jgi:hypothetical protein
MWHKIKIDETLDGWNIITSIVKSQKVTNFWQLVVTCACKARHNTEATMTPDDDPWNPKVQRHSAISESHDYGKFFVKITMLIISWNGPFRHVGKESMFPSYLIGHEHMFSHHCMREGEET